MAKITHIALSTHDPDTTARFYIDVFGMKQIGRVDHPAGGRRRSLDTSHQGPARRRPGRLRDRLRLTIKGKEALMLVPRPVVYALLAGLLAGCSLYGTDYRLWHKANASNAELEDALSACGPESRVVSAEGSRDPRAYFEGPTTPEQTNANRLFQRCMVSRGWWALQPPL